MKKLLLFSIALIGLLTTCREPFDDDPVNPDQKTVIVFDNTQGICAVTVYSNYLQGDESIITRIPAGQLSQEFDEWLPNSSTPFFFTYHLNFKGISGFSIDYKPENGKNQKQVRIDPNVKTTIAIPPLEETLSSPDTLLSKDSYLFIQNNSSYSLQLLRGSTIISPDNISETLVNSGERAQYTVNPGSTSNYKLAVGAETIPFPVSLVSFEAGCVYNFVYDGAFLLISEIELKLENVAGVSPNNPVPEAPSMPVVTAGNGVLSVHWTTVAGADRYEVYRSTTQNQPVSPERTVFSTTAVFSGLTNKTPYYIWIKAVNEYGSSDFSPRARGIPWPDNEVPAVPGLPVIIPGINQLTVTWEQPGGASSYEVYFNTTLSVPSEPSITTDKTSAVITNLENDIIYYIWVRAVNNAGKSGYSPPESGTPKIPTIAPTSPLRPVLNSSSRELYVSWQAVELAAAYEVWFGISSNSAQAQKYGDDIPNSLTEMVISGLTNETTYYVWIKAKNVVGESGFSPPANAKPSAFNIFPETPDIQSTVGRNQELFVSWTAAEGALTYEIWFGMSSNSATAAKHGVDVSGTSVTIASLTNGTTYYIWIKAKNNIGTSGFSTMASGIPSAFSVPPQAPANAPVVTAGNGELTISWLAVEGATAYEIWAGTTTNSAAAVKRGNDFSGLSAVINGLTNGTMYYVWIKAKNNMGTSGFSPMASGMPSNALTPGLYRGDTKIGNQNLSSSLSYISANAVTGNNFYIVLGANETVSPSTLSYSGKTVGITLRGYGGERTVTLGSNGSMFTVLSGVTFTLDENIKLVGRNGNTGSVVYVNNNGTFIMNNGIISGNKTNSNGGGGVCVVSGGTFTLNDGTISENSVNSNLGFGGGVYVVSGGTFTMNGGIIRGNTASSSISNGGGGGVFAVSFIMNGGTIIENIARGGSSGGDGGGVKVTVSFTMRGGIISQNNASGSGGGVSAYNAYCTFIMYGGVISGNTASGSYGGGGVFSGSGATFKKLPVVGGQNSGIIYGSDAVGNDANGVPLKNSASSGGHAVNIISSSNAPLLRNATAGETDQIDNTTGRGLSSNGNAPFGQ